MTFLVSVLKKLTQSKAIEKSSGQYETFFFDSIYRVLYITGVSISERSFGYFIYASIVLLLKAMLVCGELWYLFSVTWSMDAIIGSTNILVIQFNAFYKYGNMVTNQRIYKALASSMESSSFDISTSARREIVEIWVKRNNNYLVNLLILGTCTLSAWYGYPLMDDIEYNLMVAVYLPFDYNNPSIYPIVYVTLIVLFTYMSYFVMITDILMLTYLMQLLCQFMVLKDCFCNILDECSEDFKGGKGNNWIICVMLKGSHSHVTDLGALASAVRIAKAAVRFAAMAGIGYTESQMLKDERFRKKYSDRLASLINQHRSILSNTLKLREVMSGPMLSHLAMSTIILCSIGCQIILSISVNVAKCLMSLLYLGYNMMTLYIICSLCEEVTIQNEGIGTALYCSGWERGLATIPGVRSSLLLILTRANKPIVLTAGGMYDLSLASYADLVKTSYRALTVLLRFRQ